MTAERPCVPVIAIDGPSASGKGTVAARVAQALDFHYLDSGALYRALAYAAGLAGIALDDAPGLVALAQRLNLSFKGGEIYLDGVAAGEAIRSEEAGRAASRLAVLPAVREALLDRQRAFRRPPGLVCDGRDMGTVVFPDAQLKVYLDAHVEERALRRYKQLIEKGIDVNLQQIEQDLRDRDARDRARPVAPLQKAADAYTLDTTGLSIDEVVHTVLRWWGERRVPCGPKD